jgi:hypothetical protein
VGRNCDAIPFVLVVRAHATALQVLFLVVQGHCVEPPRGSFNPALQPLKTGQCVIAVNSRFLQWRGDGAATNVWLHGLYIHSQPSSLALLWWDPFSVRDGGAEAGTAESKRLWMTDVTLHGGRDSMPLASPTFASGTQTE